MLLLTCIPPIVAPQIRRIPGENPISAKVAQELIKLVERIRKEELAHPSSGQGAQRRRWLENPDHGIFTQPHWKPVRSGCQFDQLKGLCGKSDVQEMLLSIPMNQQLR
jgi:hypothetical protein